MSWFDALPDEIDRGFDQFAALEAAAVANLCELIRVLDVSQHWMSDGARSLDEWVSARLKVRSERARQLVRISRRLADLPVLSERFAAGELSLDQVDAISRIATRSTEVDVVEEALGLSNHMLDRMARHANPPTAKDEELVHRRRSLFLQWNLDQSELRFNGNLPGADGEIVQKALESRANAYGVNASTGIFDPFSTRLADALVELASTSGDETSKPAQVSVHVDFETLTADSDGFAELTHGGLVPNETARRLCCDAVVETIIEQGPQVIGVGRSSRVIPGWLRRLVYYRDGNRCRFPGCHHTRWLECHHRQHWAHGGETELDNLILLCGFHHRFLHEKDWHITGPPQAPVFRKPNWRAYPNKWEALDSRLKELVQQT